MTAAEHKQSAFPGDLEDLRSITVAIGGYPVGFTRTTINGTKVTVVQNDMIGEKETRKSFRLPFSREELLEELRAWNLGTWKKDYADRTILDGTSWTLTLKFQGRPEPVEFGGLNAYPRVFRRVERFFESLDSGNQTGRQES